MELIKIFAMLGVAATAVGLAGGAMLLWFRYEDRQWRKRQEMMDRACDTRELPANDN